MWKAVNETLLQHFALSFENNYNTASIMEYRWREERCWITQTHRQNRGRLILNVSEKHREREGESERWQQKHNLLRLHTQQPSAWGGLPNSSYTHADRCAHTHTFTHPQAHQTPIWLHKVKSLFFSFSLMWECSRGSAIPGCRWVSHRDDEHCLSAIFIFHLSLFSFIPVLWWRGNHVNQCF